MNETIPAGVFAATHWSRSETSLAAPQSVFDCNKLDASELDIGGAGVTLVVIDMQAPFLNNCNDPDFVEALVAQVKLAISRGWGIVIIEVKPWAYGPTIKQIMELLEGKYERFQVRQKEGDDGSWHVLEVCRHHEGFSDGFFRVTGVLIGACVKSTAWGLVLRKPDCFVRVVKEACATSGDTAAAWRAFPSGPRLVVSSQLVDQVVDQDSCVGLCLMVQKIIQKIKTLLHLF